MTAGRYEVRPMTRSELDIAIDWAAAEGWNPGLYDADAFFAADPGGYFAGVLDGELVGSISVVRYTDYAFLGFFIVRPEHRGKHYGLQLWLDAVDSLGETLTGLDGVLAQTANYARSGFEDAYLNQRFQGIATTTGLTDPRVAPFAPNDFGAVERIDRECFPAPRRAFLERWLHQPGAHPLVYRDGGALQGYGMVRPARQGYRIGPLFADNPAVANALFDALVARLPSGAPVFIDVPQANPDALALVTARAMTPMFETARMYRGPAPQIALEKVFGVTTLELG